MCGPRANLTCLISTTELETVFASCGVLLPDFINTRLNDVLDGILTGPVSKDMLENAMSITALWVCGVQRMFSRLATARKPGAPSIIGDFRTLFNFIDEVHSCIQKLQQFLVGITAIPLGCDQDTTALDHFVLLGVRADTYLVDVVSLTYYFFTNQVGPAEDREEEVLINGLRRESEMRMRKCLKLIA